jgi:chondroitin AC lyase
MKKGNLSIIISILFLNVISCFAADDLVISTFETGATNEIGANLNLAFAGGGYNSGHFSMTPQIGLNDDTAPDGLNTSAKCLKMTVKNTGRRWGTFVFLDFPNGGLTKEMMKLRKYMKIMVWRELEPNNMRISVNSNTYWNDGSNIYAGKPIAGMWVDLVIDLSKSYGGRLWGDSTINRICFQPIENATTNWTAGTATTMKVMIDNIVLSDNNMLRSPSVTVMNPEITEVYNRLYQEYYNTTTPDTVHYVNSQNADGSWSDINYADKTATYWTPMNHLMRIHSMARSFAELSDKQSADALKYKNGIIAGLNYWQTRLPVSVNWFKQDIGKQQEFMPILILMRDYLPQTLINDICTYFVIAPANNTGANLIEMASSVLVRGVLQNNKQLIIESRNNIQSVCNVMNKSNDGMQVDNSFLFHGLLPFSSSYNVSILRGVAMWSNIMKGLSFSFSDIYRTNIRNTLLQGNRWFIWGDKLDYGTDGRTISRPEGLKSIDHTLTLQRMIKLDPDYTSSYNDMLAYINNQKKDTLSGNKMFYRADYMVHRKPNYYFSVKMFSSRVSASESGNGENLKGYWLASGGTCVMRDGNEFKGVLPLWDWTKIPGTTTANEIPTFGWNLYQPSTFVGGVSNGVNGVSTMRLNIRSITGNKSWFMFDNETVCLGAAINSTNTNDIFTTVAQSRLRSKIQINGINAPALTNSLQNGVNTIFQDSIGYVFPSGANLRVTGDTRTNNWYSLSSTESQDMLTDSVFGVWFEHGNQPVNASYSYIVVPGTSAEKLSEYVVNSPVSILSNTPNIQAVTHLKNKVTGAVFQSAGEIKIDDKLTVAVDQPCAVMINQRVNPVQLIISDPGQSLTSVNVTLKFSNNPQEVINVILPTGNYTGSSLTVNSKTFRDLISINNSLIAPTWKMINKKSGVILSGIPFGAKIQLYDVTGKLLSHLIASISQIELSNLKQGVYVLNVNGAAQKVIIQ